MSSWIGDDPGIAVIENKSTLGDAHQTETTCGRHDLYQNDKVETSWDVEDIDVDGEEIENSENSLKDHRSFAESVQPDTSDAKHASHQQFASTPLRPDHIRHQPADDRAPALPTEGAASATSDGAPLRMDDWRPTTPGEVTAGADAESSRTSDGWRQHLSRSTDECQRLASELDGMRRQKLVHDDLLRRLTAQLATAQQRMRQNNDEESACAPTTVENHADTPNPGVATSQTNASPLPGQDIDNLHHEGENSAGSQTSASPAQSEIGRLQSEVTAMLVACEHLEKQKSNLARELHKSKDSGETESGVGGTAAGGGGQGLDSANQTDDNKELETMQARLLALESEVTQLTGERDDLLGSLEELDTQHQLAIDQVLASRDQVQTRLRASAVELEKLESRLAAESSEERQRRIDAEERAERLATDNERLGSEVAKYEAASGELAREIDELWLSFASETDQDVSVIGGVDDVQGVRVCRAVKAAAQKLFFRVEELEESSEHFRSEVRRVQNCYDEQEGVMMEIRRDRDEAQRERATLDAQLRVARERARTTIEEDVLGEEMESLRSRIQWLENELARERTSVERSLGSDTVQVLVHEPSDSYSVERDCQTDDVRVVAADYDTVEIFTQTTVVLSPPEDSTFSADAVGSHEHVQRQKESETLLNEATDTSSDERITEVVESLADSQVSQKRTFSHQNDVDDRLSDQKRIIHTVEFGAQTDTAPPKQLKDSTTQAEEEPAADARDASDQQAAAVMYEHVRELQAMNKTLEGQLRERDSHVASLESILHVYKENLDPADHQRDQAARSAALETERVHREQLSELRSERDQIMSVLDAKARENSGLKAEVHRLMNVVSAERAALNKMQHDLDGGVDSRRVSSEPLDEQRIAATQNQARQARDNEVEIEALRQRNQTLMALLQEADKGGDGPSGSSSSSTTTTNATSSATVRELMSEREELAARLEQAAVEKQQMIAALTQKHGESVAYHAEIQRLLEVVRGETTRAALLEQQHAAVARQYEERQRALLELQNGELALRRRLSDAEEARSTLQAKYNRLLQEEENHVRKDSSSDAVVKECAEEDKELLGVHVDRDEWTAKLKELEQLQRQAQDRDKMLYEKDCLMHEKMRLIESTRELLARRDEEMTAARQHLEHAGREFAASREDAEAARQQNAALRMRTEDLRSEIAVLKESNSSLSVTLQEREFESKALREKVRTLSIWIEQHAQLPAASSTTAAAANDDGERTLKRLLAESEEMRQRAQGFQAERDQALLALAQRQREIESLHEQIRGPREREERLLKELERLRQHLVHVEESYTQEALRAEDREKELRVRLALAEDRLRLATSSRSAESQHASLQVESLQEQLRVIMEQRDSALQKLSSIEDQLAKREAAFRTLQVVLEQLQQERQRDMSTVQVQHNSKLLEEQKRSQKLVQEVKQLEIRIEEAGEALEAASRLSEQLDRKEEFLKALREEVESRDAALAKANQEINRLRNNSEVTVDRSIMKNLVVGFLTVPVDYQRKEVLRIIATVLDFNKDEREKTGLDEIKIGWIGWLSGRSPNPSSGQRKASGMNQQSFSEAFVRFLENESKPRQQIQFPLDSLMTPTKGPSIRHQNQAQTVTSTRANSSPTNATNSANVVNPFAFPLISSRPEHSGNILLGGGQSRDSSQTAQGSSHLLMNQMTTALPTFTPMAVGDSSFNANNVLRDVLKSQ